MRRKFLPLVLAAAMMAAFAPATLGANNSRQAGLVNVSAGDVALLNGVNLAVAANVVATVCDATVGVAVLAQQLIGDGTQTFCEGTAQEITIDQSQPGDGGGTPTLGGNNARQRGLVNVAVGDLFVLNNVNIGVAANVLITACDLTVGAAVLAVQGIADTGETSCTSAAGPITLTQAQ